MAFGTIHTTTQQSLPRRSLILTITPFFNGATHAQIKSMIADIQHDIPRHLPNDTYLTADNTHLHLVWDWGACTPDDIDLTNPAELADILPNIDPQTDLESLSCAKNVKNLLAQRFTDPLFQEVIAHALEAAEATVALAKKLSTHTLADGREGWEKRFGLKAPVSLKMGLCHGKLFMIDDALEGLSLKMAADIAAMAAPNTITCGPMVVRTLGEMVADEHTGFRNSKGKAPEISGYTPEAVASAQIKANIWQIKP